MDNPTCNTEHRKKPASDGGRTSRFRCRRPYRHLRTAPSIRYCYVETQLAKDRSLDAIVGRAQLEGQFSREDMVCTQTLYDHYIDIELISIKNIDLPDKLCRNTKKAV